MIRLDQDKTPVRAIICSKALSPSDSNRREILSCEAMTSDTLRKLALDLIAQERDIHIYLYDSSNARDMLRNFAKQATSNEYGIDWDDARSCALILNQYDPIKS